MRIDWSGLVVGQLEFYWSVHLRPRLDGLRDDEFFWEPVEGCWSVRRGDDGLWRLDGAEREPSPPPVTTLAWRLVHIGALLHSRASTFFGDGSVPTDATMFDQRHEPAVLPGTAADGIAFLEAGYRRWMDPVTALSDDQMAETLGPRGAYFANDPMAALVVHLNREVMHHGAEIALLRDLYRAAGATSRTDRLDRG